MSGFLTRLNLIAADDTDNGLWVLGDDLAYYSSHLDRIVTVPLGFRTDLASVPRLPVIYVLTGDTARSAAVVHDFLYGGIVSRKDADEVLYEAAIASGVSRWRAWMMWAGVRAGGGSHYEKKPG